MSHFADEETLALIAKLQATVQEQAAEIERLLDHNKRLEESASEIIDRQQHKVKVLTDAAELVVETHNVILPIMNAYMGTLGTTKEWNKTCVASDALREALAAVKGE